MKIKRFFASDMRQALRQVREALGADAVILSNKSVDGGVELVAAMDYDEEALNTAEPTTPPRPTFTRETAKKVATKRSQQALESVAHFTGKAPVPAKEIEPPEPIQLDSKRTTNTQPHSSIEWSQDPVLQEMRQEMQALRRMMEHELSELTWRDLGQRRPQTQELIRRLMGLGLAAGLCRELANRVDDAESPEQAWQQALFHLVREIPIIQDDLVDQGGVLALVGPTGVGKTTTIAKLAARFCLRHGNRHLALITTDSYRIGAQEQLHNYGRILDVPVRSASTPADLSAALHALSEKRLILIDTAGMGQSDLRLTERLALLTTGNHPVKSLLTLSATTQRSAIAHAIRSFSVVRPIGAVLTKMDEAASLGDIFSPMIEAGLPLAFITDGQRVPEDLHTARAHLLVDHAIELAKTADETPEEEYLAYAYGGMGEHTSI